MKEYLTRLCPSAKAVNKLVTQLRINWERKERRSLCLFQTKSSNLLLINSFTQGGCCQFEQRALTKAGPDLHSTAGEGVSDLPSLDSVLLPERIHTRIGYKLQ
jgi:hypothetical protein